MAKEQPFDQDGDVAKHIAIFRPSGLGITDANRDVQRRRSSLEIKCKPAYERVVKTARQIVGKVEERRGHVKLCKLDRDVRSTCPAESAESAVGFVPIDLKWLALMEAEGLAPARLGETEAQREMASRRGGELSETFRGMASRTACTRPGEPRSRRLL